MAPSYDFGDDLPPTRPDWWDTDDLTVAWWDFHVANPKVYEWLVSRARMFKRRGRSYFGIGFLWEGLRWETALGAKSEDDDFKACNNHRAYYARWIMEREPDLAGFFRLRVTRGEMHPPA